MKEEYTRRELDRAHTIYNGALLALAALNREDRDPVTIWDACRLQARIEHLARSYARLKTRGCNRSLTDLEERRQEALHYQLHRLIDQWQELGPKFSAEFTTSVSYPVELLASGRRVLHLGVYRGN
jgi:hypothetical protein